MGDSYKQAIFAEHMQATFHGWVAAVRKRRRPASGHSSSIIRILGRKKKKQQQQQEEASMGEAQMQRLTRTDEFSCPPPQTWQPYLIQQPPVSEIEASQIEPV